MENITLFSQILKHIPRSIVEKAVKKFYTDKHNKGINTWTHLVSMLFSHIAKANSLREITQGLLSAEGNLNHLGILHKCPKRSSLSYINEKRNWQVFREIYFQLKQRFQEEGYFKRKKFQEINKKIFMMDSTVISVCINIFNWAKYRHQKGAIKLHTMLDYDGCLPSYICMTAANQSDVKHAQYMNMPENSVIVADRGYVDFKMFNLWDNEGITFLTRLKEKIHYESIKENDLPTDSAQNILKDERIKLTNSHTMELYPKELRRVAVFDSRNNKTLVLLTNNLTWTAETIAELYKQRWQIEIFFKQIKTHMKIKSFIGTNENSMRVQIWTAMISLLLIRYLKEKAEYNWSLSNLITFLRMNLFVKIPLLKWLNTPFREQEEYIWEGTLFDSGG